MDSRTYLRLAVALGLISLLPNGAWAAARVPGQYIVELSNDSVAVRMANARTAGRMRSTAAQSQRQLVRTEQKQVRARLEALNATVMESVENVANALIVQADDSLATQLAGVPGVKRIYPVRMFHPVLDHAVALHRVPEVWNQVGASQAGAGVKVAILDSGIDVSHAGFQDSSLPLPSGFPLVNQSGDLSYTNAKVIVARSYVSLLPYRDPDRSARDRVGHGTALAMIVGGVTNSGPSATITGIAPKAYLGNYKVFGTPGYNDSTSDAAILKAIDDAVGDGMDIINLSLGSDLAPRLADDVEVQAVERAVAAGVIVVIAAGNNGPDPNTIASPGTAPSAIAVGASTNERTFGARIDISGLGSVVGVLTSATSNPPSVSGEMVDVQSLDGNGLACGSLPANSLTSRIALIQRGTCTFESKLNNAKAAGAVAALIFATADSPDPFTMSIGAATLPAEMISNGDGVSIQQTLAAQASTSATVQFSVGPVPRRGGLLTSFSAAGPSVDSGIKPDVVATGDDVYVATQHYDPNGEMYSATGYTAVGGTSFSTPMVAGAAALLKAARPGLTVDQYRSLLVNATGSVGYRTVEPGIQQTGAGLLDAFAALNANLVASPVTLSFGTGSGDPSLSRTLHLTNLGSANDTFTLAPVALAEDATVPSLSNTTVDIAAGASVDVTVSFAATGLGTGAYQGQIVATSASTGTTLHIPYWYGVTSATPARVTVLSSTTSGRRNSLQSDAILFRITDSTGSAVTSVMPQVSSLDGLGVVQRLNVYDTDVPGLFGADVRLGSTVGTNTFLIQAGSATTKVSITVN